MVETICIGLEMEIYAIAEGRVLSYLLDPEFESKLPVIPSEMSHVNFTWKSGMKKYYYNFYRLKSFDESILKTPSITIKTRGRVPKRPKGACSLLSSKNNKLLFFFSKQFKHFLCVSEFSIVLPCSGNSSGIAQFGISLMIETRKGKPLNGTPLRLSLRKECVVRGETVSRAHDQHPSTHAYSSVFYQFIMNFEFFFIFICRVIFFFIIKLNFDRVGCIIYYRFQITKLYCFLSTESR